MGFRNPLTVLPADKIGSGTLGGVYRLGGRVSVGVDDAAAHWQLRADDAARLHGYSGDPGERAPGALYVDSAGSGAGRQGYMSISPGLFALNLATSELAMWSESSDGKAGAAAKLSARAPGTGLLGSVLLDASGNVVLTPGGGKLRRRASELYGRDDCQVVIVTLTSTTVGGLDGWATVPHPLGVVPAGVFPVSMVTSGTNTCTLNVDTLTSTTFRVRMMTVSGSAVPAGQTVAARFLVVSP